MCKKKINYIKKIKKIILKKKVIKKRYKIKYYNLIIIIYLLY